MAAFDLSRAVVVDFPLRGEWRALNTPASRIPSHGTDELGQRFAYDFVQMNADGTRYSERGMLAHVLGALPAEAFYCWEQPVFSAFPGRVCATGEGWPDRMRVNSPWELLRATFAPPRPRGPDYRPVIGNFVVIDGDGGTALYAHLRNGSVQVRRGDAVESGALLGRVGNSGNSTMPHLHFHIMDGRDLSSAAGVPCVFRRYESFESDAWVPVIEGVPGLLQRIRAG